MSDSTSGWNGSVRDSTGPAGYPTSYSSDYRTWSEVSVPLRPEAFLVATKPGVPWHGDLDAAAVLLARHARVAAGDVVLVLNCGNGLAAAGALRAGAARVLLSDRNVVAVEAARRTVALSGADSRAEVFASHGARGFPSYVAADVVLIRLPKDRASLMVLIADALSRLRTGGRCYLAGGNGEGVKTAARALGELFGRAETIAHGSGCRVVLAVKRGPGEGGSAGETERARDEFTTVTTVVRGAPVTLYTLPGVFSREHADEATLLLADAMQIEAGENVLDLGCGAGALGIAAASLTPRGRVVMVDADVEAVRCAAHSAAAAGLSNATALPSDVASAVIDQRFDVVVTNPPFHSGKATDLDVPLQFIADSFTVLRPGGRLYLVANRTLPYERTLQATFGSFEVIRDTPRFKILRTTLRSVGVDTS
jgi:16S rRNA (guanine1207-N2)-methyltransferase